MVAFAPVLQADLSGTAFGAAPTWTDLTRFARLQSPVTVNAWRQDEVSDVAPSTTAIVLDNADVPGDPTAPNAGRFTPDLATSPFYPRIVPGVRMRFGVTVNAVTYWLIDGQVDSWNAESIDGDFPVCTAAVNDVLAHYGTDPLMAIYLEEAMLHTPLALWPLNESSVATSAGSIVTGQSALALAQATAGGGGSAFGSATGVPSDSSSALALNESLTTAAGDDLKGDFLTTVMPCTLTYAIGKSTYEAWILINPTLSAAAARYLIGGQCAIPILTIDNASSDDIQGLAVVWDNASSKMLLAHMRENSSGRTYIVDSSGFDLNDGRLHHVVVVVNNTPTFNIDGVGRSSSATNVGSPPSGLHRVSVGGRQVGSALYGQSPLFRGVVQAAAIYGTNLLGTQWLQHYNAGMTALAGEDLGARAARLVSYRPGFGVSADVGVGTVGVQNTVGATLQQALLDAAKAEGGLVYAQALNGSIRFKNRLWLRNPPVAATLDISAQQTSTGLRVRKDRQQMANDVTITRAGGAAQRVVDAASVASAGVRSRSDTLIVGTDNDALNAAGWAVSSGKTPRLRVAELPVDLLTEPSLTVAAAVLSLAPLSRVSLTNPPGALPAVDVIVQGVTWTVGVDVFEATFYTSPLPRPTLRFDAAASAFTKLDSGNVFAW